MVVFFISLSSMSGTSGLNKRTSCASDCGVSPEATSAVVCGKGPPRVDQIFFKASSHHRLILPGVHAGGAHRDTLGDRLARVSHARGGGYRLRLRPRLFVALAFNNIENLSRYDFTSTPAFCNSLIQLLSRNLPTLSGREPNALVPGACSSTSMTGVAS